MGVDHEPVVAVKSEAVQFFDKISLRRTRNGIVSVACVSKPTETVLRFNGPAVG